MSAILKSDENGVLHLPPSLLPGSAPLAAYKIDQHNGSLIVSKSTDPTPKTVLPKDRASSFLLWVKGLPPGPGLSDQAISRDSIYD